MALAAFRLRAGRRRATRWVAATLLLALAGGAAMVAAEAARRTGTAFGRNLADSHAANVIVNANTYATRASVARARRARGLELLDAVDRSPLVVAHGRYGGANLARVRNGKIDPELVTDSALGRVAYDRAIGRTVNALRVFSGRLTDPTRADEIDISRSMAAITGWRAGTRVTDLYEFDSDATDPASGDPVVAKGVRLNLHVVGVVDSPEDLIQPRRLRLPRAYLTPAFARRFPDSVFYLNEFVRLRHGNADTAAIRAHVVRVNRAAPEIGMPVEPLQEGLLHAERAGAPLVRGLDIVALIAALIGLLLAAQSIGQSIVAGADDHAQYRALGATRGQRAAIELVVVVLVALAASVLAVIVSVLFSPLTPVGLARDAEPHGGFALNIGLTVGVIGVMVAGTVLATLPAVLRVVNEKGLPGAVAGTTRGRRSRVAEFEAQSGFGVPAVVGTQLAYQPGRGPSATPVRSVLVSLTLVVAAVTATFFFGTNLQRWTSTPRLYGWNWDAAIGSNFGAVPQDAEGLLAHYRHVVGASALNVGTLRVAGRSIPAIGIDRIRGSVDATLTDGRLPTNPHEIALGARTLRELHAHVGDRVAAEVGSKRVMLQVVGRATFPAFGTVQFDETGLGTGALGTAALFPVADAATYGGRYNYMVLRFSDGDVAATEARLRRTLAENGCDDSSCLITDSRPTEIAGYRSARGVPLAVGIVLVLFLVSTLVHALASTMRRRRGELANLRALGCTPRELSSTLRWQGLVLAGTAIVIGVPVGLVASRIAWNAFCSALGIAPGASYPVALIAIASVAVLAIATIVATVIGRRVPRTLREHRLAL